MAIKTIEEDFKHQVCDGVQLIAEGTGRYRVLAPFMFDDGDLFAIVLRQEGTSWVFSDEGHTYMHLSYHFNEEALHTGRRQMLLRKTLTMFQLEEREGELILPIEDEQYGEAFYSFVQALLKITDITYLFQDRGRSSVFMDELKAFLAQHIPAQRRTFDWYDMASDPGRRYVVDCRVNGMPRPLFIYGLPTDDRVRDATIGIQHFVQKGFPFQSVGIFEDLTRLNKGVVARFLDVCDKPFPTLSTNRDRIASYLRETLVLCHA